MAERNRGIIERLVDWFTIEVDEPGSVVPEAPPGEPDDAAGVTPATQVRYDAAALASAMQEQYDAVALASAPEVAATLERDAPSPAESQPPAPRPSARPAPGAAAAARLHDGWLTVTDAVGQAVTGIAVRRPPHRMVRRRPPPRIRPRPAAAPRRFSAGRLGILLAVLVAVGLATRLVSHPQGLGPHVDGPAVPSAHDVALVRANAGAAAAEAAAKDATAAGRKVAAQLTAARKAAQQVTALAGAALARKPSAQDPAKPLASLQLLQTQAAGVVGAIGHDVTAAEDGAAAAASVPAAARRASAAAAAAKSALTAARGVAGQIGTLVSPAQHAAASWHQIHTAPPGSLRVTTRDPPATWGVHGCEVLTVAAGGAGQLLGLTGAGGPRPVGDVITAVKDATDGHASWPAASCAALGAAMAQTRAGDQITVAYEHRATVDLVLGFWLSDAGTVVLGKGGVAHSVCPGPLTGRTGSGGTVPLTVTLSGPHGTRQGLAVTLDPAGAATYFPDTLLRALGYRPYRSEAGSGVVPGSHATVNLYEVPGSSLAVADSRGSVALADGILSVVGIPGSGAAGLGAAVLRQGAQLVVKGATWTLTPPCH